MLDMREEVKFEIRNPKSEIFETENR